MSTQRKHHKNVNVFVSTRGNLLVIIISSSVRMNIVYKIYYFLMPFITPQNNRDISLKNSRKNL